MEPEAPAALYERVGGDAAIRAAVNDEYQSQKRWLERLKDPIEADALNVLTDAEYREYEERFGLVFVTQDSPALGDDSLDGLAELIRPDQRLFNTVEREFDVNWKIFLESFIEGYHIKSTHPESFLPYGFDNLNVIDRFGRNSRVTYPFRRIARLEQVPPAERWVEGLLTYVYHLFPNVLITAHHIVTDGWSEGVMLRELGELYRARPAARHLTAFYLTISAGGELFMTRRVEVTRAQLLEANEDRRHDLFDRIGVDLDDGVFKEPNDACRCERSNEIDCEPKPTVARTFPDAGEDIFIFAKPGFRETFFI